MQRKLAGLCATGDGGLVIGQGYARIATRAGILAITIGDPLRTNKTIGNRGRQSHQQEKSKATGALTAQGSPDFP